MIIDAIKISIYPTTTRSGEVELRIDIKPYPGEEVHLRQIVNRNDLESMFDYLWRTAGDHLKAALEKSVEVKV